MKKFVAIVLSALLVMSIAACGITEGTEKDPSGSKPAVSGAAEKDASSASDKEEWEQFLADYEAWAVKYVEMAKKYEDNPADTSILTEYSELTQELLEWSTRASDIKDELANSPDDLQEYIAGLTKISEKVAEASK